MKIVMTEIKIQMMGVMVKIASLKLALIALQICQQTALQYAEILKL